MIYRAFILLLFCILFIENTAKAQPPKLVVGIVVDQMRYDYLTRYMTRYGKGGFKRMIAEGYSFDNCHFDYMPTYTGPGHASIYTGTVPAIHGIIGNNWYERVAGRNVYCTEDTTTRDITGGKYGASPRRMKTTTITDQLRIFGQFRPKVLGISLKDRGAVLPAGHSGQAFWFNDKTGGFTTSDFYMKELPQWLVAHNQRDFTSQYLNQTWNTLYPLATYTASAADSNAYEGRLEKGKPSVFPYNLKELSETRGKRLINYTPWGNSILARMAEAAIEGEQLGYDAETDFLALSFSTPDYAGHLFGPQALEMEDIYLRLDLELEAFFKFLDKKIGKGKWAAFLTADHGANDVPAYLNDHQIPAGLLDEKALVQQIKTALFKAYGDSLVEYYINEQVYLDKAKMAAMKLDECAVQHTAGKAALEDEAISRYYTACQFQQGFGSSLETEALVYRGWMPKRSGDVMLLTEPAWMEYGKTGTTHGSPFAYDTRVPLLWMGAGIKKGSSVEHVAVTDIAPTLAVLLGLQFPNGSTGKVLSLFK